MIIDTNEMDMEFTVKEVDGLILINPREIGVEVAYQFFDEDGDIYESAITDEAHQYLVDTLMLCVTEAINVLTDNGRGDDVL